MKLKIPTLVNILIIISAESSCSSELITKRFYNPEAWSRGDKGIFMLISAEHEILIAHMYANIKKFSIFSGSDKLKMLFSCS